ncbi:MAG: RNA methyltransferase [Parachlamydiales bacterium]|nr:RNA methyltransferase [Parachlamydiales bacterium]
MGTIKAITSLSNPTIKYVMALRKRNVRDAEKKYIIEGNRELQRAFDAHIKIETFFYVLGGSFSEEEKKLLEQAQNNGISLIACSLEVFQKISYGERFEKLLAIASMQYSSWSLLEKKFSNPPFLLIAEQIEKPGNLGAILRSTDAAGVDGIILCDPLTDIFNPNVVRASIGTFFSQTIVLSHAEEAFHFLSKHQIKIIATTPDAEKDYTDSDLTGSVAIAVGAEHQGLSSQWIERADEKIRIPMQGVTDSLNVAIASTLVLYEVCRQRKNR